MPDKKMDIDSFFRQRYQQLPPGTDADSDWAQMNGLLDRRPPRLRKKTTRRIIRYLGGLALVTTVTWYAVKQYRQPAQRYQPLAVSHTQARTAAAPPHLPIQSKAPTTATRPPKPTGRRRTVHRVWSDTILLAPQRQVAQQKNNRPQPLSEQVAAQPPLASTATLNNWLQQLATPTVSFRINPLRDTVLHCPQGTVIYVPAFAFFNTQRKLVETRPLSLFVKECYQYSDMVANRLSTTTPHDLLTTGGMLHLSAVADSGQIQSVLFRTLAIQMPMRQYDPAMQLYLPIGGQANGSDRLDWETAGQVQAYMNAQPYQPSTSVKLMSMQQRITKGEKNNRHYFEVQTLAPLSEQQIKSLLRERYPLLSGKIDILVQEQEAHSDALKGSLARATRKGFVMQDSIVMPFDQAWQKGLLGRRDSLAYADWRRQDSLAWRNRIVQDSLAFVKRIQFERAYRFNVGSLGWINCDRLMAPPQVPRVQFVLRCTTTPPTLGLYHLLFTNQQGIVKGQYRQGEIYFGNLPEGFAAQLICVYQQGDQVMSCVRPVRIGQQMPTDLVFSATSPERFKQQLAAMDPALVGFDEPRPIIDLPGR